MRFVEYYKELGFDGFISLEKVITKLGEEGVAAHPEARQSEHAKLQFQEVIEISKKLFPYGKSKQVIKDKKGEIQQVMIQTQPFTETHIGYTQGNDIVYFGKGNITSKESGKINVYGFQGAIFLPENNKDLEILMSVKNATLAGIIIHKGRMHINEGAVLDLTTGVHVEDRVIYNEPSDYLLPEYLTPQESLPHIPNKRILEVVPTEKGGDLYLNNNRI